MKEENIKGKYYNLIELIPLVKLKRRQLQVRVKIVFNKYENNEKLIFKKSNRWYIHESLINEFTRKRSPIDYKYSVTITSNLAFDNKYWHHIIKSLRNEIKAVEPKSRIKYVIEKNKSKIYHIHFMTTFESHSILKKILHNNFYTSWHNNMFIDIKKIWDVAGLHKYYRKSNKPVLMK